MYVINKKENDTTKVLKLLEKAGEEGVHSFDIIREVGTIRGAARVYDLKKQGYNIVSKPEKKGNVQGCRYILT